MSEAQIPAIEPEVKPEPQNDEFEIYNGFKVQKGGVEAINKRVASETHAWKEKHKIVQDQLNELSVQLEEARLAQMSDKERQAHEELKKKEIFEALEKKAETYSNKYKNYYLDTELFREVSSYDVVNAKQVLALVKAEYKTEFAEDGDNLGLFLSNGSEKLTVQEAVKKFLTDPSNANLIRSTLKPGSGTKAAGSQPKQLRTSFKRSEVAVVDSPEAKEYREAMKAGLNPSLT